MENFPILSRYEQLHSDTAVELESGPGSLDDYLEISTEFEQREREDAKLNYEEFHNFDPPQWVTDLFLEGVASKEILSHLLNRIRRSPTHELHLIAEIIVNELGETEDGVQAINEILNESLIKELETIHSHEERRE